MLIKAGPSPLPSPTPLYLIGEDYVSSFDYDVVNALAVAGDYEVLREMHSQFWNNPTVSEYGVCETFQASLSTNKTYGAIDLLNTRFTCSRWNAVHTQYSNLTNRGGASVGFCGAYKACLQCTPFVKEQMFAMVFCYARQGVDGVYRFGGKWMLDGTGPGTRSILYHN